MSLTELGEYGLKTFRAHLEIKRKMRTFLSDSFLIELVKKGRGLICPSLTSRMMNLLSSTMRVSRLSNFS